MHSGKVCKEPDVPPVGVHLVVRDNNEFLWPIQALHLSRLRIPYNPVWDVVPAETRAIIREANRSRGEQLGRKHCKCAMRPKLVSESFRSLMRGSNLTEQNSGSRLCVTQPMGMDTACRGKELEGEKQELRSVDTNTSCAKYDEHERKA